MVGHAGAVGLAEGVSAGDQRDGLFVVHAHAAERFANVLRGRGRIGLAVRAFRIDVDEAHLHGRERIRELAIARIALVAAQPRRFLAPVDVLIGFPHVRAAAAEAEGLEAHRLERDVAGEDQQIGPRDLLAVLLLDRPQQPARLVEVAVVGPAVERRVALLAPAAAAAAVADAIGAGAVPGHADEQRTVVTEVRRPPGFRVGHHRREILLDRLQVEAVELFGVVEIRVHRIGLGGMLMEQIDAQRVRPPVAVAAAAAAGVIERALGFG